MGIIYSVGITKNHFDVAPEHGRTTSRDTRCITVGLLFILRNQKMLVIRRII